MTTFISREPIERPEPIWDELACGKCGGRMFWSDADLELHCSECRTIWTFMGAAYDDALARQRACHK